MLKLSNILQVRITEGEYQLLAKIAGFRKEYISEITRGYILEGVKKDDFFKKFTKQEKDFVNMRLSKRRESVYAELNQLIESNSGVLDEIKKGLDKMKKSKYDIRFVRYYLENILRPIVENLEFYPRGILTEIEQTVLRPACYPALKKFVKTLVLKLKRERSKKKFQKTLSFKRLKRYKEDLLEKVTKESKNKNDNKIVMYDKGKSITLGELKRENPERFKVMKHGVQKKN